MDDIIKLLIEKTQSGELYWLKNKGRYETKLQANYDYIYVSNDAISYNGILVETKGINQLCEVIEHSIVNRHQMKIESSKKELIKKLTKL